jgi:hypothetical protein
LKAKKRIFALHPSGDFIGTLSAPVEFKNEQRPDLEEGFKWVVKATHLKSGTKKTLLTPIKLSELTGIDDVSEVTAEKITGQYYGGAQAGLTIWLNGLIGSKAKSFVEAECDYDLLDQAEIIYTVTHEPGKQAGTMKAVITRCTCSDEWLDTLEVSDWK